MFALGERVKLKVSGREGIVAAVYEPTFTPGSIDDYSYMIELDGGVGTTTVWESGLEYVGMFWKPECTCGLKYVRSGGRHSEWCDVKDSE